MRRLSASDIVLKALGLLLLTATLLKAHELLTVPVANSACTLGRSNESEEWSVTTPAVALMTDGKVTLAWEAKAPDLETLLQILANRTPGQTHHALSCPHYVRPGGLRKGGDAPTKS